MNRIEVVFGQILVGKRVALAHQQQADTRFNGKRHIAQTALTAKHYLGSHLQDKKFLVPDALARNAVLDGKFRSSGAQLIGEPDKPARQHFSLQHATTAREFEGLGNE
ncbi:MAG: hypothetical protein JWM03_1845 [Rhodocyclales bacterium]|nr:hypothetical protein [Rhodocyclales bacterium]